MATTNFDVAAGLSQGAANNLLIDFYKNPPKTDNPFNNSLQTQLANFGNLTLTWSFDVQPTIILGAPSQEDWNNALDSTGTTNQAANHALPTEPMIQLIAPSFTASYTLNSDSPVGGTAKNVQVYGTLSGSGVPSPNSVTASMVAVLLDETGFKPWDSAIFNDVLIPIIFQEAAKILRPIQMPGITWNGISLNSTWDISISGNADSQLIVATTLTGNPNPLSTSGISWPADQAFCLVSTPLLQEAAIPVASLIDGLSINDDDQPFKDGSTWSFDCTFGNATVAPHTINPLTFTGTMQLNPTASADISDTSLGNSLAACALTAFDLGGSGGEGEGDSGVTVTYDVHYKPSPLLSLTLQVTVDDSSLSVQVIDTDFDSCTLVPDDSDLQGLVDSTITLYVTPIADLIASIVKKKIKSAITSPKPTSLATIKPIPIGKDYQLTLSQLALGDAQMPFGDILKLSCQVALSPLS